MKTPRVTPIVFFSFVMTLAGCGSGEGGGEEGAAPPSAGGPAVEAPAVKAAEPPATQPTSQPSTLPPGDPRDLAVRICRGHGAAAYPLGPSLEAKIVVRFGGREVVNGVMLHEIRTGRARLDLADGTTMVFDGEKAWVAPAARAAGSRARFSLVTWPYFLVAPFKLRDPGTHLERGPVRLLGAKMCETGRLTFDPGTGDAPDDWYVIYAEPGTDRLLAMAYVVTYGKSRAEVEAGLQPHAISYDDFVTVDGVTFSTAWTFHAWSEEEGVHGPPIGEARVTDVRFVTPARDAFARPADSAEDPLPVP